MKFRLALMLTLAATAQASTIIYSNIQPGDIFGPGIAIGLVPFVGVYNLAGIGFNAGSGYTLDSFQMAVSLFTGPNVLDVYLMDTSGGLPDNVLESWELDDQMTASTSVLTIDSLTHPLLQPGQEYWIVAGGGPTTTAFWAENAHNITGPNVSGGSLTTLVRDSDQNVVEALEVEGTPVGAVPEPATWTLILSALVLGAVSRTLFR